MTADKIKNRISEICSHFTFTYRGTLCGVDPLSANSFDMWCGDKDTNVDNLDAVMNLAFFNGKSLAEIADEIEIDEF